MYTIDNCPRLTCRNCKFYKCNADQAGVQSACKRIDHKKVRFAKPFFMSYDCSCRMICADFEPMHPEYADLQEWTNADDYLKVWDKAWRGNEPKSLKQETISFTLGNDNSIRYNVPFLDFFYGKMIKNGKLMAISKTCYKMIRKSPTCYELYTEIIDKKDGGIQI